MSMVITEDRGPVRHVVLNRPEKRNAMSQELLLGLGEALRDAAEAERTGLVNRVVEPDALEDATQGLVDELLANSPVAVGRAKRVIDASARPALAQTLEMEVAVQEYCVAAARERARAEGALAS